MTEFEAKIIHMMNKLNTSIDNLSKNIEALLIHYILESKDIKKDK